MIWFFLMGMIAGAVGILMLAGWWVRKHTRRVTMNELKEDIFKEDKTHD